MNYQEEQDEILGLIDSTIGEHSGYGWSKFQGDVVPRIISHYIGLHLPVNLKIVGPNVYIDGVATEFDLMVVDADSQPLPFTVAYPSKHVKCIIEVKRRGIFGNLITFKNKVQVIKSNFDNAIKSRNNCKAAYITISETTKPKNKKSHNYGKITKEILTPYPCFILQDSRSKSILQDEWYKFCEYVTTN